MAWLLLVVSGFGEIFSVMGLNKLSKGFNLKGLLLLVFSLGTSFYLLSIALQTIPMGTAYGIWTGIGTIGVTVVGMLVYGESRDVRRLLFIGMIMVSTIGLKLVS
ncbi:multidrug efflux SMR transporter [Paenibacillus sp. SYP-B3998]|uniref:Multidrug efflux SMR transporter n=1 Tax=Paenibacillus sp. SYP-B3998 TaxID=2678564 RepID=A0A6G4A1R6_9BACL|nr:multidrug efflux SMR transporter [Paenibacillus sp. SYP-B3998]NEW07587.1 multidrug efflux SMR transporter [Paenibacillus sp. SYP-B3998]